MLNPTPHGGNGLAACRANGSVRGVRFRGRGSDVDCDDAIRQTPSYTCEPCPYLIGDGQTGEAAAFPVRLVALCSGPDPATTTMTS